MAGVIDAFLAFGQPKTPNAPKIAGETLDTVESKGGKKHDKLDADGLERSIGIKSYTMAFAIETSNTEETNSQDGATQAPRWHPDDVTINKFVDNATPALLSALSMGARYKYAVISQRKAAGGGGGGGAGGDYFWIIHMEDVTISRLSWNADDGPTTEQLTLKYYGNVKASYYRQKTNGQIETSPVPYGVALQEQSVKSKDTGNGAGDGAGAVTNLTSQQAQDLARKLMPTLIKEINRNNSHLNLKG